MSQHPPGLLEIADPAVRLALQTGVIDEEDLKAVLDRTGSSLSVAEALIRTGRLRSEDLERLTRLSAAALDQQSTPARLGRYEIRSELGRGASSRVFLAADGRLKRLVALKVLHLSEATQIARFLREARVAASLDHPNIVRVFDAGEEGGRLFIAMQPVEGSSLRDVVLSIPEAAAAARDTARALQHAHERGILHRDVKPGNILRDSSGRIFLSDFGLARPHNGDERISMTGAVLGTPCYMAPEQATGNPDVTDARCDIYALGITLYELLTGNPPYQGTSPFEIIEAARAGNCCTPRSINPQIPESLESIVLRAMAPDPARRYETAAALADDLDRFLSGKPISATRRPRRLFPRRWIAIAIVLGGVLGWFAARPGRSSPNEVVAHTPPVDRSLWIYRDALPPGWFDWSWRAEFDWKSTEQKYAGSNSIQMKVVEPWGGLQVFTSAMIENSQEFKGLELWAYSEGETTALFLQLYRSDMTGEDTTELEFLPAAVIPPGSWQRVFLPMNEINSSGAPFNRIALASERPTVLYLDDIRLVPRDPAP